ncbi:DUF2971 domain-containing protein [Lactobacillus sanfranciscensis]|nr:DUF2971 domain-containing protein [Fructilactobacillus sanfranciscensis]NDR96802.1 DUF2971 domain-containing protein [Fructilactobacillus sanfranciscensis]NDS05014.1 DUF2971 domain-containing protein [Fructilactobacillus sanfranciscensis]POH18634.1 hypothetical protein BGL44_06200 [Fructilactobacillus sanfranciscensis]POH21837.1 hypothetical protein BGL47_06245 [Fructilactobacillus sanfranciscensis]
MKKIFFDDKGKTIFHYTTIHSLNKITKNHVFLIKAYDFMNDPIEFRYSHNLCIKLLKGLGANKKEIKKFKYYLINKNPFKDCYIWSFTENKNSQALYGNYSSKKDGIALEFNANKIQIMLSKYFNGNRKSFDEFNNENSFIFPLKVIYDINEQKKILLPVLNEYLQAYKSIKYDEKIMNEIIKTCLADLVIFSMSLKNPLLYQEEEIRYVVANINENDYKRPTKIMNGVPFMDVPFKGGILKSAYLQTGNKLPINLLKGTLKKRGYPNVYIGKSELPY